MNAAKQRVLYVLGTKALQEDNLDAAAGYLSEAQSVGSADGAMATEVVLTQGILYNRRQEFGQAAGKLSHSISLHMPSTEAATQPEQKNTSHRHPPHCTILRPAPTPSTVWAISRPLMHNSTRPPDSTARLIPPIPTPPTMLCTMRLR